MTPVFAHGHLRLYLLSLLADSPMHGYELMQALEQRFGGTYVPSAGTIYPRLAKLEEEGLVTKVADGRKTTYAITDAGRAELEARSGELGGIEEEVTDTVRRLAAEVRSSVNSAMRSLRADLASAARDARHDARATMHADRTGNTESADRNTRAGRAAETATRVDSRGRLQEAELALATFRQEVRSELRLSVVRGELPEHTLEVLREGLESLRSAIRTSLTSPPVENP